MSRIPELDDNDWDPCGRMPFAGIQKREAAEKKLREDEWVDQGRWAFVFWFWILGVASIIYLSKGIWW